jgi:tyrosine-protein kinase Etk/Wzc
MSNQNVNPVYNPDFEDNVPAVDSGEKFRQFIYRILPFWPLFVIAILGGLICAYTLLHYATPIFQAKTRLVVNDETQEKSTNLHSIFNLDTRDLSNETEKEIEIIRSKDLLKKVASQLQLNVKYFGKGKIKAVERYEDAPFKLELEKPDSIKGLITGDAKISGKNILFKGILFPVDTFIDTKFGKIKWYINPNNKTNNAEATWIVSINSTENIARQLKSAISVTPISKKSSIVDVVFADLFPDRSVKVLNTLIEIYGKYGVDFKSRLYANTKQFLDERLNIVADELNGVEQKLQELKTSEGIIDLGTEGDLYLNKLKQGDAKIGEIGVQIDVLNEVEQYVVKRNSNTSNIPATLGITDPVLLTLLNQLYQAEFELEKIKQLSGDKNPQIEVLEQVIKKLRPSILSSISNLKINLETSRKALESDNLKLSGILNKIPIKERLLLDISREQGIKNAIYTFLLQKREETAIGAASVLPNYRVIERPSFVGAVAPNKQNYYLLSIALALFIVGLFIYFKEFYSDKLVFKSQIESNLSIPVIGELIYKPSDTEAPMVVGEGKRTLIAEQFRELRTNLNYLFISSKNRSKVILITSSIPAEGKSFVAINTAVSLSLTGARVLLLEFDLRKPKISKPLGIAREPGITNYLIGKATEKEIIKPHPSISNFYIAPSGPVPPNPAELIGTQKLNELVESLKLQFDYLIIDSPPIAAVTDAKLLARFVDVTLYILRYNFTSKSFLRLILETYQKKNLPNLNLVFNGIENKKILGYGVKLGYGYGYGYGYSYVYGYGYNIEDNKKHISWWKRLFKKLKI